MQPHSIPSAPTAQGKLSETPLAHVLLFALQRRFSGLFKFFSSPERTTLMVSVEIDCTQHPEAIMCEGGAAGLVRLQGLLASKDAYFEFHQGYRLSTLDVAPAKADVITWICQSSKINFIRDDILRSVLTPWGSVVMTVAANIDLKRLGFDSKDLVVLQHLQQKPHSMVELYNSPGFTREVVDRVVYLLAITKLLRSAGMAAQSVTVVSDRPGGASQHRGGSQPLIATPSIPVTRSGHSVVRTSMCSPSATVPPTSHTRTGVGPHPIYGNPVSSSESSGLTIPPIPDPPGQLAPELKERWKDIQDRIGKIEHQTYFDMFNLSKRATDAEIQQAYFALAKTLHPDRLQAALAVIRPQVQWLFSQYTDAYHTLSDQEKRTKYSKGLDGGGGTLSSTRKVQMVIEAAMEFKKLK